MKNQIKEALQEIRYSLNKIYMLEVFLESVIIFLVGYVIFSVSGSLNNNSFLAILGISALYYVIFSWRKIRINKIKLVEKKFSKLKERLVTAHDYSDEDNEVVKDLHKEVIRDLSDVDEGAFVKDKAIFLKSLVIVGLCFLIIFLAPINLQTLPIVEKAKDLININIKITAIWPQGPEPYGGGPSSSGLGSTKEGIYGQKKLITLGNIEKQLDLRATSFEVNVKDVQDVEEQESFGNVFPSEIVAQFSALSEEENKIPKDQQEIVKQYFRLGTEG